MVWKTLEDDLVRFYDVDAKKSDDTLRATLFWGDSVDVKTDSKGRDIVEFRKSKYDSATKRFTYTTHQCLVPPGTRFRTSRLLRVRFIDVGQGDAAIIETPAGKRILVDGGEEDCLLHYVNASYQYLLKSGPVPVDAIVVTHGDADHFEGLTKLVVRKDGKMPLVTAKRVYHNGLVKGPSTRNGKKVPDKQMFGATKDKAGATYITALEDDLRTVPDARMNEPFIGWKEALGKLGSSLQVRRLAYGDAAAFNFLDNGITMTVLGPITETVDGKPALRFLRSPGGGVTASHTVNGHSIVLKLAYGNVRFLFGADLNEESEERLLTRAAADGQSLAAEVLKVPHHGSAEFTPAILEAIRPVVSVISSGDENSLKEYIHPRAGLVGALGKYSRAGVDKPLIYVTEMVAFFEQLGKQTVTRRVDGKMKTEDLTNVYWKKRFGIVHVRTDGNRVLVVTHSGKDDMKESYAFTVDARGNVAWDKVNLR